MSEAERLADFARAHFPDVVGTAVAPEEVGRLLVTCCRAGPRLWTGLRILRSLGVLVDGEMRPN